MAPRIRSPVAAWTKFVEFITRGEAFVVKGR
jgi:hypothetical protein